MKRTSCTLSCLALVSLLVGPAGAANELASAPTHFNATIGGFLGASYEVQLLPHGTLDYWASERGERVAKHVPIRPTAKDWQEFRATLDALGVWKWQAKFANESVMDGTHWSLELAYADHVLNSQGSNSYPDANGKSSDRMEPTLAFQSYLAAVKKLIGGRSFE